MHIFLFRKKAKILAHHSVSFFSWHDYIELRRCASRRKLNSNNTLAYRLRRKAIERKSLLYIIDFVLRKNCFLATVEPANCVESTSLRPEAPVSIELFQQNCRASNSSISPLELLGQEKKASHCSHNQPHTWTGLPENDTNFDSTVARWRHVSELQRGIYLYFIATSNNSVPYRR